MIMPSRGRVSPPCTSASGPHPAPHWPPVPASHLLKRTHLPGRAHVTCCFSPGGARDTPPQTMAPSCARTVSPKDFRKGQKQEGHSDLSTPAFPPESSSEPLGEAPSPEVTRAKKSAQTNRVKFTFTFLLLFHQ